MPPRNRLPENDGLADNVYPDKKPNGVTYYYYQHPTKHWKEPLGKDKGKANRVGESLNKVLEGEGVDPTARTPYIKIWTVCEIAELYIENKLKKSKIKAATLKHNTNHVRRLARDFQGRPLKRIDVPEIYEYLDQHKDTIAIRLRYFLIELFDYALSRGYLPYNHGNPAAVTEKIEEPKRKRQRLTYDEYKLIYKEAPQWLKSAMWGILHTTCRPIDVVNWRFTDIREGSIFTAIRKSQKRDLTGKHLKIQLSKGELEYIERVRKSGILSPYFVHKMPGKKGKPLSRFKDNPTQLTVDTVSREFSRIRDALGVASTAESKPTLYECRSLSARLYEQQGRDKDGIKELMAHTSAEMTDVYLDDDSPRYVAVAAGLELD